MALIFPTPSEIADDYLTYLKTQKPEVNISQTDSDWWVRSRVVGGLVSGIYADQNLLSNDAFPQTARHDALAQHLITYFNRNFNSATQSDGTVQVTGQIGSFIPAGTLLVYTPNGNSYSSQADVTLAATAGSVDVISVAAGQGQNLLAGAVLTLSSPPAGVDSTATALTDIADGTDSESDDEARAKILARIQNPPEGGTASDYQSYAEAASQSVVNANVIRFYQGLGTLGIVIQAGTTNIDEAIDNGQPIVVIPSDALVAAVQSYVDSVKVLTDCVTIIKPATTVQNVTVAVKFASGNGSTILSGQTLTQSQLVAREVQRAIYKTPPGGRVLGSSGYVVQSDIEQAVDVALSDESEIGSTPILLDRQVSALSTSGANRALLPYEIAVPGTITIIEM